MEGMYFCRAKDGLQINTIRLSVYMNEGIFLSYRYTTRTYRQMLDFFFSKKKNTIYIVLATDYTLSL